MATKRNLIKNRGYIPCQPMKNWPNTDKPYKTRTPHDLTVNELLKKLCSKGPEGCNETCENWGVCEYGKAITERAKGMRVAAKITLGKRGNVIKYFRGWDDLCGWVKAHHEHVTALNAEVMKADEIGKESETGDQGGEDQTS